MGGAGEGAMIPREAEPARSERGSDAVNWAIAVLLIAIPIGAVAGVVVALSSGMPTLAIVIALVTGAVLAGVAC